MGISLHGKTNIPHVVFHYMEKLIYPMNHSWGISVLNCDFDFILLKIPIILTLDFNYFSPLLGIMVHTYWTPTSYSDLIELYVVYPINLYVVYPLFRFKLPDLRVLGSLWCFMRRLHTDLHISYQIFNIYSFHIIIDLQYFSDNLTLDVNVITRICS